ncbi:hypothetical protein ACJX0J_029526, partial [Zea mays]
FDKKTRLQFLENNFYFCFELANIMSIFAVLKRWKFLLRLVVAQLIFFFLIWVVAQVNNLLDKKMNQYPLVVNFYVTIFYVIRGVLRGRRATATESLHTAHIVVRLIEQKHLVICIIDLPIASSDRIEEKTTFRMIAVIAAFLGLRGTFNYFQRIDMFYFIRYGSIGSAFPFVFILYHSRYFFLSVNTSSSTR